LKGKKLPIKTSIIFASSSKFYIPFIDPEIPDFRTHSRPSGHSKLNINLVEVHPVDGGC
jgi:hypothetical protein